MKLHGFMTVKNEVDIVAESVSHNLRRLDGIVITDNGSEDGTWELLQEMAAADNRILLFRDPSPITTRSFHRNAMRIASLGHRPAADWAVQCDCDEFHESDVRSICEAANCDVIFGKKWQFVLLPDSPEYGQVRERLRWRRPEPHRELRAYRNPRWFYVRDVVRRLGLRVSPSDLNLSHYQCRSQSQIDERLATRRKGATTYRLAAWRRGPGQAVATGTGGLLYRHKLDEWLPEDDR